MKQSAPFTAAWDVFLETDESDAAIRRAFSKARALATTFDDWLEVFEGRHTVPHNAAEDLAMMAKEAVETEHFFVLLNSLYLLTSKSGITKAEQITALQARRLDWLNELLSGELPRWDYYLSVSQWFHDELPALQKIAARAIETAVSNEQRSLAHEITQPRTRADILRAEAAAHDAEINRAIESKNRL